MCEVYRRTYRDIISLCYFLFLSFKYQIKLNNYDTYAIRWVYTTAYKL